MQRQQVKVSIFQCHLRTHLLFDLSSLVARCAHTPFEI